MENWLDYQRTVASCTKYNRWLITNQMPQGLILLNNLFLLMILIIAQSTLSKSVNDKRL